MRDHTIPRTDAELVEAWALRSGTPEVSWSNNIAEVLSSDSIRDALHESKDARMNDLVRYLPPGTAARRAAGLRFSAIRLGLLPEVEACLLAHAQKSLRDLEAFLMSSRSVAGIDRNLG